MSLASAKRCFLGTICTRFHSPPAPIWFPPRGTGDYGHVYFMGRSVELVNIHRLCPGLTSAVVEARFSVTAIRPR